MKQDAAHVWTDRAIKDLERRIAEIYVDAGTEIINNHMKDFEDYEEQLNGLKKQLEDGSIDYDGYKARLNQIASSESWFTGSVERIADTLVQSDRFAAQIVNDEVPRVFAENLNYETYRFEHRYAVDTTFHLVNQDTVKQLLTDSYGVPQAVIDEVKAKGWNTQHVQNEIIQGVVQGKSIPDIASGIMRVSGMDCRDAVKTARTMMTGAQNSGRLEAMQRLAAKGVNVKKQWVATLDDRTRESHRLADGEIADVNEEFKTTGLMEPGDPNGDAAEIMNCRCTMVSYFEDVDSENLDDVERASKLGDMSYSEWKAGKNPEKDDDGESERYESKPSRQSDSVRGIQMQIAGTTWEMETPVYEMSRGDIIAEINERYRAVKMEDEGVSYNKITKENQAEWSDSQLRSMLRGMRYGKTD